MVDPTTTGHDINRFLASLQCSNGGKHSYYRALRAFFNWLFSAKSGYGLDARDNPMLGVEPPKVGKRIMSSITEQQCETLINTAGNLRDKAIISLLFDSGMRLSELASVKTEDIHWDTQTISVIGKGNKQRRAPFTATSAQLLRAYLASNHKQGTIWGIDGPAIAKMLKVLGKQNGIKCNPHAFRRGFACRLHRKGLSTLDIMHLGGWEDLSMVQRYTRAITFEDCLEHYRAALA
ncbi:MAG: tyrosine-type recombinase/integrase [Dehalococcoidia bacterium]|nr:tyrosine-type recombinase/integrase [Dehalococcoidia bacterium]